jgi:hypothetical protein
MTLEEAKNAITAVEDELSDQPFVIAHTFTRDGRDIHVGVTGRLKRIAKKGRVWHSKHFLTAFKNASYGYDDSQAISAGGYDGIFRVTRDHRPANEMMRKLFGRFLDKADSGAQEIADAVEAPLDAFLPVRVVSHHLRLLGILHRGDAADTLVLVDYDDTKG